MKFKSKSLISVVLSVMMVISMILAAVPVNAAVVENAEVGAQTLYLWSIPKFVNSVIDTASEWTKTEMVYDGTNYSATFKTSNNNNDFMFLISRSSDQVSPLWGGYMQSTWPIKGNVSSDFSNWTGDSQNIVTIENGSYAVVKGQTVSPMTVKFEYNVDTRVFNLSKDGGETPTQPETQPTTAEPTEKPTEPVGKDSTFSLMDNSGNNLGVFKETATNNEYIANISLTQGTYNIYIHDNYGNKNYRNETGRLQNDGDTALLYRYADDNTARTIPVNIPASGVYTFKWKLDGSSNKNSGNLTIAYPTDPTDPPEPGDPKIDYIKSQGDGLWIDANPDDENATATLIKWNNYQGSNHGIRLNYIFYVPKNVDLSKAHVYNGFGSAVNFGGQSIPAYGTAVVSLNIGDNNSDKGSVKVMQGSTDAMFLYTTDKNGDAYDLPTQKGDSRITAIYKDGNIVGYDKDSIKASGGACITMTNSSSAPVFDTMELDSVKGRGNSSWKASTEVFGKYAYNMKLKRVANLFGMAKDTDKGAGSKSWCLLANNADEAMLRNAFIYQLADEIGLEDSPEFRFVDVYDNSEYMGSYLVTEKVDVGNKKLVKGESYDDINEKAAAAGNESAPEAGDGKINEELVEAKYSYGDGKYEMHYAKVLNSGGTSSIPYKTEGKYLLEFEIAERYQDEASYFTSPRGQHVVVKSPEFATKEQVEYIAKKFAAMEEMAFDISKKYADLSTVMDVDSFAKMYLIQEFSSNLDAASTSYYVSFDCAKTTPVFVASPVWDYDWALGQYDNSSKKDVNGEILKTHEPTAWVAKRKSIDDSTGGSVYSVQSQLADNSNAFKMTVRKVWEADNGFYNNINKYYGENSQLDKWRDQIYDSVDMNETRWGFIQDDNVSGWGSADNSDTFDGAVDYLENKWTAVRVNWLNNEFKKDSEYPLFPITIPTVKLFAADGKTEISEIEAGKSFIIMASTTDAGAEFRLYKDGVQVGKDSSSGKFVVNTDTSMIDQTLTYTVRTVFAGRESVDSAPVSVTVFEVEGAKTVRIYFKSASAAAYVPTFTIDSNAPVTMKRDAKNGDGNGTYFGATYSGSLKFYWYYTDLSVDPSAAHKINFVTKDRRVNATMSYTFTASGDYYFAVDNLMKSSELVDLTGKDEYIRNYHVSATHMVYAPRDPGDVQDDANIGFTFIEGKEYAMGSLVDGVVPKTASADSMLLSLPSALTPSAMLAATSAPLFFDVRSATLAQKLSADMEETSELQYQLLDTNLDGVVDVRDATMMQKFITFS